MQAGVGGRIRRPAQGLGIGAALDGPERDEARDEAVARAAGVHHLDPPRANGRDGAARLEEGTAAAAGHDGGLRAALAEAGEQRLDPLGRILGPRGEDERHALEIEEIVMRRDIDRKARAVADEGAHQFGALWVPRCTQSAARSAA